MRPKHGVRRWLACVIACALLVALTADAQKADPWKPDIPRVWIDAEMAALEVPLADTESSPRHISADYYYQIPVQTIRKNYPVYAPGREPAGYIDRLRTLEAELAFDESKLVTEADWIAAGELVFDAPITTGSLGTLAGSGELYLRDPEWYQHTRAAVAKDGTLPFYRYVINEKGKVEIGMLACGQCHTRVMPDGTVLKGAQGNFPFDRAVGFDYRKGNLESARVIERILFATPRKAGLEDHAAARSLDELAAAHEAIPPGVVARHRSSTEFPPQVPDLIGVKDRRYLDRSGLQIHRSLVDLMRYATLNQGMDDLASFRDFIPAATEDGQRPAPGTQMRYSDAQLYALALFVYSLQPPPNPNPFDARAERGQAVFERERCGACHTAPLFTNNRLTPAIGFTIPPDHRAKYEIAATPVGTDPRLTMQTRRGTGYYKVPSLKGVWYRGPFEHNGSVATLEDWFDARRLRDDYVPTGFIGAGIRTRAVRGHEFGLSLSADDKRALIAFLKTL